MYELINAVVRFLKKIVPKPVVHTLRKPYHAALALLMAASYGFPARKLVVIGITGTKGKSTAADMLFAILRASGRKTALLSTIRFAIEDESEPNRFKMTLQGRGFAQAFMRKALARGCTHIVIEVTSEAVMDYRHWFLAMDGLIVTNIQREHIEHHGSFENYVEAKRAIVRTLARSPKSNRALVSNADIPETKSFLSEPGITRAVPFSMSNLSKVSSDDHSVRFSYCGISFSIPIPGTFNAMNALACVKMAETLGVTVADSARALVSLPVVRGRVERIDRGQPFTAIVDYAHTPDSLRALYAAFPQRKICVLGNTGGGRDTWKRPLMGQIADEQCAEVILTNEDPYDEDPRAIVEAMAAGMKRKPRVVMDRREAIREALQLAQPGGAVLVTGKGTDPFIMEANGAKTPWSDAQVVSEELEKLAHQASMGAL